MLTVLDEIIEKSSSLTDAERHKLIELLSKQTIKPQPAVQNGKNDEVSPNMRWMKKNRTQYAGKYVALKDGKLVGQGRNIKEAHLEAKKNGVEKPLLTYLFPLDRIPFGGW